ncbi:MAG: preprotein translocase subunit SecY [Clostridiales bacterium]|nr:preprotein translocase subunit SecY [Clostridiales bacterium]
MLETLKNAWKMADLKKKLIYTFFMLLLFRIGSAIPVPFLETGVLKNFIEQSSNNWLGYIDLLSGGSFSQSTLFALGISPYITASIVIQLLAVAIPALENLAKEGEEGRKLLNKYTRYTTVALAALNATAYYFMMRNMDALSYTEGWQAIFAAVVIIVSFMAGAMLVMWMGEQIDNKGIGNGISMILFAGIVSRAGSVIVKFYTYLQLAIGGLYRYYFFLAITIVLFLAAVVFIIVMTNAERRIPVQYAQRVVGRKMYGGQSSHIPIKVNMSGVLPVIFASSILGIPGMIAGFMTIDPDGIAGKILGQLNYNSWIYAILYFFLIMAFNYFYIAIQYNPMEIANNLRKNNGTIPGIRPGKPTADFISRVVSKVTVVGGIFLAIIAIGPILLSRLLQMDISLGGTSIIIVVGVALDTVRQLESQMMMRHYKGFLE